MPDLKAAAKRLRGGDLTTPAQDKADRFFAAQALEAWAWQQERVTNVIPWGMAWRCYDGEKIRAHADTPLGAVLAAMEGEKDGND